MIKMIIFNHFNILLLVKFLIIFYVFMFLCLNGLTFYLNFHDLELFEREMKLSYKKFCQPIK